MTLSFPSSETITRVELQNGITVLAYENHNSPAVVVSGYLWAGAISEAPDQAGLANMVAGTLMRGTEKRTFTQTNEMLESVGARFGFGCGVHTVGFGGKALVEDLDLLLDVLADSLQSPTFPVDQVNKLQGQVLTGLQRRANNTQSMARLSFDAMLFPDHPYGRSVQGYEETVSDLGRDDLASFYRKYFAPQGMVIAVVGAISTEAILDKVRTVLGTWNVPNVVPNRSIPPALGLPEQRRENVILEGKTQSDILLGWPALSRRDPDFMKARLANTVLGVFGMMGRLGDTVRDQQGLAYYVYSSLEAGVGPGAWVAVAGVNPANVEKATDGILREVGHLRGEPLPAEELADSQSFLTGSMPLRLETNEGIAGTLVELERHELGLDYLLRYPDLVNAVTVQDVQQVARAYLDPEVYVLAIAGPGRDG